MIDTNCHLLPMCGDGPDQWEQSLEMAREAVRQGISDIIVTPSHGNRHNNPAEKIASLVRKLDELLQSDGIMLRVHAGQEFCYHEDYDREHGAGSLQTLGNSRYLLITLPQKRTPKRLHEFIHDLGQRGRVAVIAHPERHVPFIRQPERMKEWLRHGVLFQLAATSLLGYHGADVKKRAWQMARDHWVHLLGSDAHDLQKRNYRYREAYQQLAAEMGQEMPAFLEGNARRLLEGHHIPAGSFVIPSSGPPEAWHRWDFAVRARRRMPR